MFEGDGAVVVARRRGPRANPLAVAALGPEAPKRVEPVAGATMAPPPLPQGLDHKSDAGQPAKIRVGTPEPLHSHAPKAPLVQPFDVVSVSEVVAHAAEDSIFFCHHFFPKTFRQESPDFHRQIWSLLDNPAARYINVQVQRDGAKTTLLRAYAAKRIAYGLSRTILYIGASQDKAKSSVGWIKSQVERNKHFTATFGLSKSPKNWTSEKLQILHGAEGHSIWVLALGITGSVRGINLDDYRPDLIIIDDVVGDDNASTEEQRLKIRDLVLGALKESLSPASETPDAKMIILNTPRDFEDVSQRALKDPQFHSARFGCWTVETEDLPVELQESSWTERYPSDVLRREKEAAIARNELSIFAREKECRLITPETSSFRAEWLKYYGPEEGEPEPPRHEMWVELVIDPVPPPSEIQIAKGLVGKDFEALSALGRWKNKYYVLETIYNRGHQPNWTVATFFEMCSRWSPRKVIVEAIAYQATLAWLLREGMKRTGRFYPMEEFKDKRKKIDRIKDGLSGPASNGALYVRRSQSAFISQFIHYPGKNPDGTHDDVLETVAIGVSSLSKGFVGDVDDNYYMRDDDIPKLEYSRGAP